MTRWDEVTRLAAQFKIEDSEPEPDDPFGEGGIGNLSIALNHAETAYELASFPENDSDYPDDLDEVARSLECAADLLDDAVKPEHQINSYRLERELDPKFELEGLCDKTVADLRSLATTARRAHRQRGRGQHRNHRLEAAVKVLMNYWEGTLGRKFTVGAWPGVNRSAAARRTSS